jgi:DEAD/DEAH box helicase domain-containing protein
MNLDLFADQPESSSLVHKPSLDAVLARMQEWMAEPNSPVRSLRHIPARPGQYSGIPATVDKTLQSMLRARGMERLYSHQCEAYERIRSGSNTVIVTPTASGKTLCYNLPVLNSLCRDPDICALYLFPTKALAEDQLDELQGLISGMGSDIRAFTYDGDTPQDARKSIRQRANIVLTNPDMLHSGVLPHHTRWARFFEHLEYIVIDELAAPR